MPIAMKRFDHDNILAAVLETEEMGHEGNESVLSMVKRRNVGIPKFLRTLRDILDNSQHQNTITWTDNGTAVEIRNMDILVRDILPKYFRHSKYASFQRQLNYFGFRKISRTKTAFPTFRQPYFSKKKPEDVMLMKRITGKDLLEAENRLRQRTNSHIHSHYHPHQYLNEMPKSPSMQDFHIYSSEPKLTHEQSFESMLESDQHNSIEKNMETMIRKEDELNSTNSILSNTSTLALGTSIETPCGTTNVHIESMKMEIEPLEESDDWWVDYLFECEFIL